LLNREVADSGLYQNGIGLDDIAR